MQLPDISRITVDKVDDPIIRSRNVSLDVLRLDKIHPVISGNKWFKLKYHLDNYNAGNYKGIITFGGAWSNHIIATACACYLKNIKCTGIIRGEKPPQLSPTLHQVIEYGMELVFVSRESYKEKNEAHFISSIDKDLEDYYLVPEGGAGQTGEKGAAEIMDLVANNNYDHLICTVGTGTMFNGIRNALLPKQELIGIVVLKGWNEEIGTKRTMLYDYHFGGYAKYTSELLSFMNEFYQQTNIPTDFVYTGKLAFGIYDLIKKDHFKQESKILMIHSGGLQGNASLQKGSLIF